MIKNKEDKHIGKIIGIYKILYISGENKYRQNIYRIKCIECEYENEAPYKDFYRTKKCRHIGIDGRYKKYNYEFKNHRIKEIFNGMRVRCYNTGNKDYRWYGAKGIKVCDEWLDNPLLFEEWALSNGYTDDLTIDRIDENKDYCPENCRWISREENTRYKSTTQEITVGSETHTGREWAKILGLGTNVINTYIRKYGIDNVAEFIKRYKNNTKLKNTLPKNKSIYSLYMS